MALSSLAAARCRGVRPCSSGSSSAPEARAKHQLGSCQFAHKAGMYGAAAASAQVHCAVSRAAARRPLLLVRTISAVTAVAEWLSNSAQRTPSQLCTAVRGPALAPYSSAHGSTVIQL